MLSLLLFTSVVLFTWLMLMLVKLLRMLMVLLRLVYAIPLPCVVGVVVIPRCVATIPGVLVAVVYVGSYVMLLVVVWLHFGSV